jgi:hypothetical protein
MEDGKCTHVVVRDDVYRSLIGQAQPPAETASRLLEDGLRDGHFGEIAYWIAERIQEVVSIEQFRAVTDRVALALSAATKANGGRLRSGPTTMRLECPATCIISPWPTALHRPIASRRTCRQSSISRRTVRLPASS